MIREFVEQQSDAPGRVHNAATAVEEDVQTLDVPDFPQRVVKGRQELDLEVRRCDNEHGATPSLLDFLQVTPDPHGSPQACAGDQALG